MVTPALLTSTSRPPKRSTARATTARAVGARRARRPGTARDRRAARRALARGVLQARRVARVEHQVRALGRASSQRQRAPDALGGSGDQHRLARECAAFATMASCERRAAALGRIIEAMNWLLRRLLALWVRFRVRSGECRGPAARAAATRSATCSSGAVSATSRCCSRRAWCCSCRARPGAARPGRGRALLLLSHPAARLLEHAAGPPAAARSWRG